jgi:hypothetical protein
MIKTPVKSAPFSIKRVSKASAALAPTGTTCGTEGDASDKPPC